MASLRNIVQRADRLRRTADELAKAATSTPELRAACTAVALAALCDLAAEYAEYCTEDRHDR